MSARQGCREHPQNRCLGLVAEASHNEGGRKPDAERGACDACEDGKRERLAGAAISAGE
jgi:hypothetical protein